MNGRVCVDASVAVKWLLPEDDSDKAVALLNDALGGDTEVIAPPHFPAEVTSAVYKRLRAGEIKLDEAQERLGQFGIIPLSLVFPAGLIETAVDLAAEFDWPFPYDAFYLAAGMLLDCEVWTADGEFYEDAHATYPRVRWLSGYASG